MKKLTARASITTINKVLRVCEIPTSIHSHALGYQALTENKSCPIYCPTKKVAVDWANFLIKSSLLAQIG